MMHFLNHYHHMLLSSGKWHSMPCAGLCVQLIAI